MSARKFQKFHFVVLRVCVQANYRVNAKLFADASWWRIVIFFRIASKQTRLAPVSLFSWDWTRICPVPNADGYCDPLGSLVRARLLSPNFAPQSVVQLHCKRCPSHEDSCPGYPT